ncbi:MAG TPA: DNA-binding protein, partial [Acidimicrobiia bacterium]|nr:DNA-binding protein [Acidimicrobiia bacterium]
MTERAVAVFGSSDTSTDSPDWLEAVAVGESLARAGFAVVTGGYGGTMEAVSLGAAQSGGRAVGVTVSSMFPGRSGANSHVGTTDDAPSLS